MLLNKKEKLAQFLSGCSTAPPSGMKDYRDPRIQDVNNPGGHCYWKGEQPKVLNIYIFCTWNSKQPCINGCLVKQPFPM